MNRLLAAVTLVLGLSVDGAYGQSDAIRSEFSAALHDAQASQTIGPAEVALTGQASLQLPADHLFVPMPAAARLIRAMGNTPDPHLVGIVFPPRQDNWMTVIQFESSGHILDDDARDWNVDQLLRSVSDGTEQGNEERRRFGFPEIQVLGWAEKPRYDEANHRLVWAVAARDKGAPATSDQGVNYNTYVLGRDGYFKLNFVTDLKDLRAQIPAADAIVAALRYDEGKRYTDFNRATDRVADFGVAALVAGVAAKKVSGIVEGGTHLLIRWAVWLAVLLVLVGLGFALFRFWIKRPQPVPATSLDDFPSTEIATVAMDQFTMPMYIPPAVPRPDAPAPAATDQAPAAAGAPAVNPSAAPESPPATATATAPGPAPTTPSAPAPGSAVAPAAGDAAPPPVAAPAPLPTGS